MTVLGEASWLRLWIITYKDIFRKDNPQVEPGSQGKTEETGLDSVSEFSIWMCSYEKKNPDQNWSREEEATERKQLGILTENRFWAY